MNKENFDAWIAELRTTDKKQGVNVLKRIDSGEASYCCLGIGCELAGIEESRGAYDTNTLFAGYDALAPREFFAWLGLPEPNDGEADIFPDWPLELTSANFGDPYHSSVSASAMNDSGFTFAQIADVFAYFGVRG